MMLSGIKVVGVEHAVACPTTGQILGDLGAEVIKIEKPVSGDHFRDLPAMSPFMFVDLNRSKKSAAIDLRDHRSIRSS